MPAGNPNAYNIPGDPSSGIRPDAVRPQFMQNQARANPSPNPMAQQNASPNAVFNRMGQRPQMPSTPAQQAVTPSQQVLTQPPPPRPRSISQLLSQPSRPMAPPPQPRMRPGMDQTLISQLLQSVTRPPMGAPMAPRRPF